MKKIIVFLLCGVAGLCGAHLVAYWCSPVRKWESVGPVQVLTNGKETWIFLQFDTWEQRAGLLVSPRNVVTGKRQAVVEISKSGVKEYRLRDREGPTFGPNSSYILHHDGHFLLLEALGSNRGTLLYRWTGGENPRFDRLDDGATGHIVHEEGLENFRFIPSGSLQRQHDGWTRVASSYCRSYSPPLRFDDKVLSFDRSSFTLTLPQRPFKLVLK